MSSRLRPNSLSTEHRALVEIDYFISLPVGYSEDDSKWPLLLFLHGAGESGRDLEKVKSHGPPKLIAEGRDLPFVVIAPQCRKVEDWWPVTPLLALLDEIQGGYRIDPDRVYVTGLSMGGYGTWALACEQPGRFAAVAPICGGGVPRLVPKMKKLPVWAFHGAKDTIVPLSESQRMVDALAALGGRVRFTVFPEAGHDAWTAPYSGSELYQWLLSHRRST